MGNESSGSTYSDEKIDKYDELQKEYKKLLVEYKDIESDDPQSSLLSKKIKELNDKQKDIQELSLELKKHHSQQR